MIADCSLTMVLIFSRSKFAEAMAIGISFCFKREKMVVEKRKNGS